MPIALDQLPDDLDALKALVADQATRLDDVTARNPGRRIKKSPPGRRGLFFRLFVLAPGCTEILMAAVAGPQKFGESAEYFSCNGSALASPAVIAVTHTTAH
jgi:hypothetical protein